MNKHSQLIGAMALWFVLGLDLASAQTNRTWTGSVSMDWFNPNNWSPTGVPATNDVIIFTNGTINLTAPVVINGQFNWSGGTLSGDAMTIASNGVMNISGTTTLLLENALTNFGTVIWTNHGDLAVLNGSGIYFGLIENLTGALFDIQCDQSLFNNAGTAAYFRNGGMLRKSANTGSTSIQIPIINSGSVTAMQGTLSFGGGGTLASNFTAVAGAAINFSGGSFTNSGLVSMNGPGTVQLIGNASLTLLTDAIANLQLVGGTVYLGPAFQSGAITNFSIDGATLAGTNIVTGTFNWDNGTIEGPLTIANGAKMNISGTTTLLLENTLTNAGTVVWTNHGDLAVLNGSGIYFGLIENLSGALFDIQSDQSLFNNAGTAAYFRNAGTLRKSANTGSTSIQIPIINSGSVTALQGTLSFGGGGTLASDFTAVAGAAISFSGGNFTNAGSVSINGPGTVQLIGSASLTLLTDAVANLPLAGGSVKLGPSFQGGAITNLTIAGATLVGTNTVTGTFNWDNGTIVGPLTIANGGTMNISGTTTLLLENTLTNAGTVIWTNHGDLAVLNGSGIYFGLIENLSGALFDIQCDQSLYNNAGTAAYFRNAGTLRKSANMGSTSIQIPIINSGNVTALQGTLNFGGGGILAGAFAALTGATINFSGGSFTNSTPVAISGPGTVQLIASAMLTLLTDAIANLPLAGGSVYLGPAFQGGAITNLTIAGATLTGTNTVNGTFNWDNGAIVGGSLTIASNGVMNISGSTTLLLESPLTNYGVVTWTNTSLAGDLAVLNGSGIYFGLIENLTGALFDIRCDQSLFNNVGGPAYFHNAGTLQKSAKSGTTSLSIPVTNSGTISSLKGNLAFSGGFTPIGGALLFGLSSPSSFGTVSISGNATLGGTVGVLWLNGFVPASGNSFTVLNYGSYTGIFTNVSVPSSAAVWVTNYGPTSFTLSVASINKLAFTTQPAGGVMTNVILAPVVVQIEDPSNNPVAAGGVPITLSLNSGSGILSGTPTQNTDSSGKASFGDLRLSTVGTKTLRAASSNLTATVSIPFQTVSLVGETWGNNTGFLLQLNGSNSLGTITIYASTNLVTWLPIYTNAPTNGPILFLDSAATNYRARFYKILEP